MPVWQRLLSIPHMRRDDPFGKDFKFKTQFSIPHARRDNVWILRHQVCPAYVEETQRKIIFCEG